MSANERALSSREEAASEQRDALGAAIISTGADPDSASALRLMLYAAAGIFIVVIGGYFAWQYWSVWRFEESTDDAYVQADIVPIAPQVAGYIDTVLVNDNQRVRSGEVLATLDSRGYVDELNQAKAELAQAEANIDEISAQLREQGALIDEAQATLQTDQPSEVFAQLNSQRFGDMQRSGSGSLQRAQQAASAAKSTEAVVAKDKAALDAAEKEVDTLNASLAAAQAKLDRTKAALAQAQLNLEYTTLRSPTDGVVGSRMLRVGLFAQPGSQLLAIVPVEAAFVVANFKETQLAAIRPGQKVDIEVDTFAGTPVRGFVESIAPASGQEFSLLPPDNATGNFTKIVQRIPVKITIDKTDPLAGRLLPGMSVTVTIRSKGTRLLPSPETITKSNGR